MPSAESQVLPYRVAVRCFVLPDFDSHFAFSLPVLRGWPGMFALPLLENFVLLS